MLARSCSVPPGLMRLQKSLLPRAAPNPRPRRRVFLAGTLRPSQASCPHAPRAPRARPQSRGPRSSRGQSRCRRALCRPLPEAPVSSRSCPLLPRPPHRCGPSRGDGSLCPSASGSADRKRGKSEQTTKSPGKAVKDAEMTTLPRSVKDRGTCVQPRARTMEKREGRAGARQARDHAGRPRQQREHTEGAEGVLVWTG